MAIFFNTYYKDSFDIPPSIWADYYICKRRFYYQVHHFIPQYEVISECSSSQFNDEEWWQREVKLPSGARLDLWIVDEQVAIAYKSERPHFAHIVQVLEMMNEMMLMGLYQLQFQLWYDLDLETDVEAFATKHNMTIAENELGFYAIWVEPSDIDYTIDSEYLKKYVSENIDDSSLFVEEKTKERHHCIRCRYFEYCSI